MTTPVHLLPLDPAYPTRLRGLPRPPATITVQGGSLEAPHVVAIVGSRDAHDDTAAMARELARQLVNAGAVVASGGALGIDASAHVGALEAAGRTWVVAPTGHRRLFPPQHKDLFDAIARGPGAMLWPFSPTYNHRSGFVLRNRVLVALADAVVVAQAGRRSGALHAAACALRQRKPLWVVPAPPWRQEGFEGTHQLIERIGRDPSQPIRPLTSNKRFLAAIGVAPPAEGASPTPVALSLSGNEAAVFSATSTVPLHLDEIAARSQCPSGTVAAVLLTLALKDVVVEGPPGSFRRRDRPLDDEDR